MFISLSISLSRSLSLSAFICSTLAFLFFVPFNMRIITNNLFIHNIFTACKQKKLKILALFMHMCVSLLIPLSLSLSLFYLSVGRIKLCITKTVKSLRKPAITPTNRHPGRQPDMTRGHIHMHVTAFLSIHLSCSLFLSLYPIMIKKKLPDIDSTPLHSSLLPTKYVFICVNFCQKDSGNYHVWATGFP